MTEKRDRDTALNPAEMRLMAAIVEADQEGKLFNPRSRAKSRINQMVKRLEQRGLISLQTRLFLMPKGRRAMAVTGSILRQDKE